MHEFPHHFSADRTDADAITLHLWEEDGTGCMFDAIRLTHAVAIDLLAVLAAAVAKNPYAR
jgi:hypothetical protein